MTLISDATSFSVLDDSKMNFIFNPCYLSYRAGVLGGPPRGTPDNT